MIIIFVAVVLVLGTGKLPGAAKKMGKVVSEYNSAKNEIQKEISAKMGQKTTDTSEKK